MASGKQMGMGASRGERVIAVVGGVLCLLLTWRIWSLVAMAQNTWLFPALYFIELAACGLTCGVAYWVSHPSRQIAAWIAVGVLTAFSVLGAWTVGLHYAPVAALFLILVLGDDLRHKANLGQHAAIGGLAAIAQTAVTLLLARLM